MVMPATNVFANPFAPKGTQVGYAVSYPATAEQQKKRQLLADLQSSTTSKVYTAEDARLLGVDLATIGAEDWADWQVKFAPKADKSGFDISVISPDSYEFFQDESIATPEGEKYTKEDWAKLQGGGYTAVPGVGIVEDPERAMAEGYWRSEGLLAQKQAELTAVPTELGGVFEAEALRQTEDLLDRLFTGTEWALKGADEAISDMRQLATESPGDFIDWFGSKGRSLDSEMLLKVAFPGISNEEIADVFSVVQLKGYNKAQVVKAWDELRQEYKTKSAVGVTVLGVPVLPEAQKEEVVARKFGLAKDVDILSMAKDKPDELREKLQNLGRTITTDRLVRALYPQKTEREVMEYFFGVEEGGFSFSKFWRFIQTGVGDMFSSAAGAAKWFGLDTVAQGLGEVAAPLEMQRPQDTAIWGSIVSQLPFQVATLPLFYVGGGIFGAIGEVTGLTGKLATTLAAGARVARVAAPMAKVAAKLGIGNAWELAVSKAIFESAGAASFNRPFESLMEAGDFYNQAIASGMSEAEASRGAQSVFTHNLTLFTSDALQFAVAFTPLFRGTGSTLVSKGLAAVGRGGVVALTQAGEEYYQAIIQKQALGEDISAWAVLHNLSDQEIRDAVIVGGFMGGLFAGAGEVAQAIQTGTSQSLTGKAKAEYTRIKAEAVREGLGVAEADERARQAIAQMPEGQKVIQDVVQAVKIEEYRRQIKAKTDAEAQRLDAALDARRPDVQGVTRGHVQVVGVTPETALAVQGVRAELPTEAWYQERWDSAKLGIKVDLVIKAGWVTKVGKLTKQGERFAESKWQDLPPAAQNVIKRQLSTLYEIPTEQAAPAPAIPAPVEGMPEAGLPVPPEEPPPLPVVPETKIETPAYDPKTLGMAKYTIEQAKELSQFFGKYIVSPDAMSAYELQRALFSKTRAQRFQQFRQRIEELHVGNGLSVEEAFKQAKEETLSGKLPTVSDDFFQQVTDDLRNALFSVVYHNQQLQLYPSEMVATLTALTNALSGQPIPRKKGTGSILFPEGGSAWDRLNFVFGTQPQVLQAIDTIATDETPLSEVIDTVLVEGRYRPKHPKPPSHIPLPPIPVDEEMAEYLRGLPTYASQQTLGVEIPGEARGKLTYEPTGQLGFQEQAQQILMGQYLDDRYINPPDMKDIRTPAQQTYASRKLELDILLSEGKIDQTQHDIEVSRARDQAYPLPPVTRYEYPIEDAFKQVPMLTDIEKHIIVNTLKQAGLTAVDIGNLIRANKASFDFSFFRQAAIVGSGHPMFLYRATIEAWKSMWSQQHADANSVWITRDPDFELYEAIKKDTGADPLRLFRPQKGLKQYEGTEEYGYLTGERPLQKLAQKLPWIKISQRSFETGTNTLAWLTWKSYLKNARMRSENIASGKVKLKEGQAFDIKQEMTDFQRMLAEMMQRGSLGRFSEAAPILSAFIFAPRATIGQIMTPRHLLSANPRVRVAAFRNLASFVTVIGGVLALGVWRGWWDVEDDPRSGEFGVIRVGNIRVDPWAGNKQYVTLYTRLIRGTGISATTGAEFDIDPIQAFTTFIRGKASPLAAIIADFWTGRNFAGDKVDISNKQQWLERITPFAIQDIIDAYRESGSMAVIMALPAIIGQGVQTYTGDWSDNWTKLGTSKYPDNLSYDVPEPYYDMEDFWSDTVSQFKGVDPATLTQAKGFPTYIKHMVETKQIMDSVEDIPNRSLISINADPVKGPTFVQYYQMWQDRQKITNEGKLKEFDDKYTKAYLGNMTQREYALLVQYHSMRDENKQAEFLEQHPELETNPRQEYLRSYPEENARLALYGQAKVYTRAAYDKVLAMARELDIPDSALVGLPPKNIADTYFKYQETVSEHGGSSAEAKLLRLENPEFDLWGQKPGNISNEGWQPVKGNVEALKITVRYREQDRTYDALDSDSEKLAYLIENPEYAEARYRREAHEKKYPADMIEEYVDFREATVLQGYDRKLYLWKHQDFYKVAKEIEEWEAIDFSPGTTVTVGGATMKYYNPRG